MDVRTAANIAKGVATYVPGLYAAMKSRRTGGTDAASYCYSVWLRHLLLAHEAGLESNPKVVAELGPGDSLGMGLAALLTGAEQYTALDISPFANMADNLRVFDELLLLFSARADIPGDDDYPGIWPKLPHYDFPHHLLTPKRMERALDPVRTQEIRDAIISCGNGEPSPIHYVAPWQDERTLQPHSVDFLFSQAVLEHVDALQSCYKAMHRWLKPNGLMSHGIDYSAHSMHPTWNAHWTWSDPVWTLIRGRRDFLINREPHSVHRSLLHNAGFEVVAEQLHTEETETTRENLAPRYRHLSTEDLRTRGAFIQSTPG